MSLSRPGIDTRGATSGQVLALDPTKDVARGGRFVPVTPSAGPGGAATFTEVEVTLGAAPQARRSGKFTITDAAILVTSKLLVIQTAGPYTGKGTRADEAEMDQITCVAKALSGSATVYWHSAHRVRGNYKFHYLVGE